MTFLADDFGDVCVLHPASDESRGPEGSSVDELRRAAAARLTPRQVLVLVVGGLAGALAGVDIVLVSMLEVLLRGLDGDLLRVPGIVGAGWSAAEGVTVVFQAGAAVVVGATTIVGATIAWAVVRYRPTPRSRPATP